MNCPWHSVFDNSMRRPWLYFCYRFDASVVNSFTLSIPCSSCHSVFIDDFKVYFTLLLPAIYGSAVTECFLQFHASAMTLFLLSIWCVSRQFSDAINSMLYLSLSIHWRFQGLRLLCFGRRFMYQPWHSVFDNSMRRPWLYFCFPFDASVVNSLTLSIPCSTCRSVFIDDFKVYCYSVLAADLWISRDIAFLTIPCVRHDSIFDIDLMCWSWIHWRCRFHAVAVTQYSLTISRSTVLAGDLWISRDLAFLTIPCISHDSIFAIDLLRLSWFHWRCRFHAAANT
jgi:hypothetical protein